MKRSVKSDGTVALKGRITGPRCCDMSRLQRHITSSAWRVRRGESPPPERWSPPPPETLRVCPVQVPIRVGTSLLPLVDFARTIVPPGDIPVTPIYARCTAGCRLLPGPPHSPPRRPSLTTVCHTHPRMGCSSILRSHPSHRLGDVPGATPVPHSGIDGRHQSPPVPCIRSTTAFSPTA